MVTQQIQGGVDEVLALVPIAGHRGVLGGALVPAANHGQDLQVGVLVLQTDRLADEAQIVVQPSVQGLNLTIVVDPEEGVAQVGA